MKRTAVHVLILVAAALLHLQGAAASEEGETPYDDAIVTEKPAPEKPPKAWNEYDGRLLTLRAGFGFLIDTATYQQDSASKQQMELSPATKVRDLRLLLKGQLKFLPRVRYTLGYMYDGPTETWRFRQTGFIIDLPELSGSLFVGRTKEGFSTNKIMVGYHGWTNERSAANDAFLPILADGLRFTGQGFDGKLVYNLGVFVGTAWQKETYVKNDGQAVGRAVWLPLGVHKEKPLLHLALQARYGKSKEGTFQFRSKPESFPAQSYAVDTGVFAAEDSKMSGVEAYYRPGPLMFGSEYFWNQVRAPASGDPMFHGGEVFVSYLPTGEIRPYNEKGAIFGAVSPKLSVFKGGLGAWELVLRYSHVNLDGGSIRGGKFSRITPMVNWHMSDNARLEFVYGHSWLDRFGVQGTTQFFQTRLQLSL